MIFQSGQQNIVLTSMVVNNVEERFILCRFHTCFCFVSFPVPEENEKKIFFSTCSFDLLGTIIFCRVKNI